MNPTASSSSSSAAPGSSGISGSSSTVPNYLRPNRGDAIYELLGMMAGSIGAFEGCRPHNTDQIVISAQNAQNSVKQWREASKDGSQDLAQVRDKALAAMQQFVSLFVSESTKSVEFCKTMEYFWKSVHTHVGVCSRPMNNEQIQRVKTLSRILTIAWDSKFKPSAQSQSTPPQRSSNGDHASDSQLQQTMLQGNQFFSLNEALTTTVWQREEASQQTRQSQPGSSSAEIVNANGYWDAPSIATYGDGVTKEDLIARITELGKVVLEQNNSIQQLQERLGLPDYPGI